MLFRFYIRDRYENLTAIKDPIGWDSLSIELRRDKAWHGLFFDFQNNVFEYTGIAARILRDEYRTYGIEGSCFLLINYECGQEEQVLYEGRFLFAFWEKDYGDDCAVKLQVETTSDIMVFRNRLDQKVNLESLTSFDQTTVLPAYSKLPFTQTLPAKSIFVEDFSENTTTFTPSLPTTSVRVDIPNTAWNPIGGGSSFGYPQAGIFQPTLEKIAIQEIGGYYHPTGSGAVTMDDFDAGVQWSYPPGYVNPSHYIQLPYSPYTLSPTTLYDYVPLEELSPLVNYDEELGSVFGNQPFTGLTLDLDIRGDLDPANLTSGLGSICFYCCILAKNETEPTWISTSAGVWSANRPATHTGGVGGAFGAGTTTSDNFNKQIIVPGITLTKGDRLYFFMRVGFTGDSPGGDTTAFFANYSVNSHIRLSGLSLLPDTTSKLFMVNEAFSRIVEAITDDKMRVYSELYGRTDSAPYATAADGCGSMTAITPGLFVRRMEEKLITRPPLFNISMRDMWEGLSPIHNIGIGIEPDTFRSGYNRVRIESWRHFYSEDVILECTGIAKITQRVRLGDHVARFTFGYDKWEAEEYNGIDEFLSKREYRTELSQCNNTFSQLSKMVSSGFALEITRRKGNAESKDWRYDNETFVIAMKRDGSDIVVNQGDVNDPDNIVDPDTIYNFELRPSVMALRWLPIVLASYKQAGYTSKLIFTNGDGNYYAAGYSGAGTGICRVEYGAAVSEKDDLLPYIMEVPDDGLPIWDLEDIIYEHPMTVAEWKRLLANPKGLIYYEGEGVSGHGWINTVRFTPEAGMAEFTLIPKREDS